jgi:predicted RNA-binding Zn ribbon-like protein
MTTRPLIGEPLAVDLLNTRWRSAGVDVDLLATVEGFAQWLAESGQDDLPATEAARAAACEARAAIASLVAAASGDAEPTGAHARSDGPAASPAGSRAGSTAASPAASPAGSRAGSTAASPAGSDAEGALNAILARGLTVRAITGGVVRERAVVTDPEWTAAWRAAVNYLGLHTQAPGGIRQCRHPDCVLHFFDPTGRRRWCSMAGCGNRAKAKRHYARGAARRATQTRP